MKKTLKATRAKAAHLARVLNAGLRQIDLQDVAVLAAAAFLTHGVSLIYRPAGHIALGVQLYAVAYLIERDRARTAAKGKKN